MTLDRINQAATLEGCIWRAERGTDGTLGQRLLNEVAKADEWTHKALTTDEDYAGIETADDPNDLPYQAAYQLIQGRCDNLRYR